MSWIYVPVSVDSPSHLNISSADTEPSVTSKSTTIVNESFDSESRTDTSTTPQSTVTSERSTPQPGVVAYFEQKDADNVSSFPGRARTALNYPDDEEVDR